MIAKVDHNKRQNNSNSEKYVARKHNQRRIDKFLRPISNCLWYEYLDLDMEDPVTVKA